jgi:hypothetical protein
MTTLDPEEIQARLDAIREGPWTQRATDARKQIAAPTYAISQRQVASLSDLTQFRTNPALERRIRRLEVMLRPHSPEHIPTQRDQQIRDSFDNALDQLELMDLAIETGYLPEEAALPVARSELVSFLWSYPAREFVDHYEYAGIESLAQRAGLRGLRPAPNRPVDPTGAPHFAAFLATHRTIEEHGPTQTWLRFLDDYVIRRNEQVDFYEFLNSGESANSRRRLTLVTGAYHFAVTLSDFLTSVPESLRPRFARFYLYWLAKLFGYRRAETGAAYLHDSSVWGASAQECWAQGIEEWYSLRAALEDDPTTASLWKSIKHANVALRNTWVALQPSKTAVRIVDMPEMDTR